MLELKKYSIDKNRNVLLIFSQSEGWTGKGVEAAYGRYKT